MIDLPFTTFWTRRASQEYKETVVKRALEQLKDSPEAHRELAASINAVVKIPGFKNSSMAYVPQLTRPVVRQVDFSNDLAAAVLKAWAKSRQPLHDAVAERLANSGISVDYPDFDRGGFRGVWSASDWRRERDAILERHGEFESDDVLLMLCYTTGRMPSDDEAAGEPIPKGPNMLNTAALSQWKGMLNSLPADSRMWEDEIPAFAEWLSNLAGEKAAERGVAIRWREVVSEMSEPGPMFDLLSGMGLSVDSWTGSEFDSPLTASKALETAEELKAVLESLDEHLAGRSDLVKVNEFQDRAQNLHSELIKILASSRRPDDEPPKPKNVDAEPNGGGSAPLDISAASPVQDAADASALSEDDSGASVPDDKDARGESDDGVSETEIGGEESDEIVPPDAPTDDSADNSADGSETGVDDAGEDGEGAPTGETAADPKGEDDAASPDELKAAMWAMVEEDDLSGAYWIARSLEARGSDLSAPSRLFAAAQGAKWLSPNSDAYVEDLFEIVSGHEILEKNDVQKLLGLAAALQASVIKPETNLAAWLDSPESCRQLERVVAPIREFEGFGIQPEDVDGQDGIENLRNAIAEASADAREWLEETPSRRPRYKAAADVLRHLCADGGELQAMLSPVVEDFRSGADDARIRADRFMNDASAGNEVDQIHQRISTGSSSKLAPIVGAARNWLIRNIQEAAKKAILWCDLVERMNKSASGGNKWWMKQVSNLRGGIASNSGDAFSALDELRSDSRDGATVAAVGCVARSLTRLLEYLRLPIPESAALPAVSTVAEDLDAIAATRAGRLETAMGRRLIWTPSARLGDDCLPAPDGFDEMGRRLLEPSATLPDALKRRVEIHQDHRFYDVMSVRLSENERADLEALREKARKGNEDALYTRIKKSRDSLEQAVIDGVLERDDNEWQTYNGRINEIAPEGDDVSLEHVLNFRVAHERIADVETGLANKKIKRRDELRQRWSELAVEVRQRVNDNGADLDAVKILEEDFSQAESKLAIRVMDVCVDRLREHLMYLESGGQVGDRLVQSQWNPGEDRTFEAFMEFVNGIQNPETYSASILTNAR